MKSFFFIFLNEFVFFFSENTKLINESLNLFNNVDHSFDLINQNNTLNNNLTNKQLNDQLNFRNLYDSGNDTETENNLNSLLINNKNKKENGAAEKKLG